MLLRIPCSFDSVFLEKCTCTFTVEYKTRTIKGYFKSLMQATKSLYKCIELGVVTFRKTANEVT